jgi:ribose transport system ATP-binding protein
VSALVIATADAATRGEDVPLLRVIEMSKRFGATQALDGATIDVRRGEVHVLLGENGAGKSTLAKIIAGIHRADAGTIYFEGNPVQIPDIPTARRLGIGMIFQELSLAPHLTVQENLFLGVESGSHLFSLLRRGGERVAATPALRRLGIDIPLDAVVADLTIAQKQMIEVAKVLVRAPKFIIMDEPTSTLTEREKSALFEIVRELRRSGVAVLYVTHHLREIFEIGDTISAMRDGKVVTTRPVSADLTEPQLLKVLTGRDLTQSRPRKTRPRAEPLLQVSGLRTGGCNNVSLTVGAGEIVGVYGVMGCGRETLGRVLVGLEPCKAGEITLDGRAFNPRHPAHAANLGVGYLPMDRKEKGILPSRSIRENLNLSNLSSLSSAGMFVSSRRERAPTIAALKELLVRYRSAEDTIVTLSGGNQQRVLFGRAVAARPKLLVLEDPTAGIDAAAKRDLHDFIRRLADEGKGILVFSSDLIETLLLCDRVYTMYSGRITDHIVAPTLDDERRVLAEVLGRANPKPSATDAAKVAADG